MQKCRLALLIGIVVLGVAFAAGCGGGGGGSVSSNNSDGTVFELTPFTGTWSGAWTETDPDITSLESGTITMNVARGSGDAIGIASGTIDNTNYGESGAYSDSNIGSYTDNKGRTGINLIMSSKLTNPSTGRGELHRFQGTLILQGNGHLTGLLTDGMNNNAPVDFDLVKKENP